MSQIKVSRGLAPSEGSDRKICSTSLSLTSSPCVSSHHLPSLDSFSVQILLFKRLPSCWIWEHLVTLCVHAKWLQSCLTLCDLMGCGLPGSSVHGILQARIMELVAMSFSRGNSWPRDQTHISGIGRWILYHWSTREVQSNNSHY